MSLQREITAFNKIIWYLTAILCFFNHTCHSALERKSASLKLMSRFRNEWLRHHTFRNDCKVVVVCLHPDRAQRLRHKTIAHFPKHAVMWWVSGRKHNFPQISPFIGCYWNAACFLGPLLILTSAAFLAFLQLLSRSLIFSEWHCCLSSFRVARKLLGKKKGKKKRNILIYLSIQK